MLKEGLKSYHENLKHSTRNSKLFLLSCFFIFFCLGGLRVFLHNKLGAGNAHISSIMAMAQVTTALDVLMYWPV